MAGLTLPITVAAFTWWFTTGVILYLDGLPRRSFRWSLLGATCVAVAACVALRAGRDDLSHGGAYLAFVSAVLVWGWHEMSFLMGFVTGPRRSESTPGARGWQRFSEATLTLIHHELAIAACAALMVALTWGGANFVGPATFIVLWAMRLSAKLNLFLGVRNLGEEFLPPHLQYLKGYFRRARMNLLFPVSITVSTAAAVLLARRALAADGFDAVAHTLIATLLALAILEHWFMVLPLPVQRLWQWGLRSHRRGDAERSRADDRIVSQALATAWPVAATAPTTAAPESTPLRRR